MSLKIQCRCKAHMSLGKCPTKLITDDMGVGRLATSCTRGKTDASYVRLVTFKTSVASVFDPLSIVVDAHATLPPGQRGSQFGTDKAELDCWDLPRAANSSVFKHAQASCVSSWGLQA